MSRDLLEYLRDAYAFEGTPGFHDLGVYHVPYDDLVGGAGVEQRLGRGCLNGERLAVIGGSGSGKSSVIAHVLAPSAEGVAPILVPVMALPPDQLVDLNSILDRIVEVVLSAAVAAEALEGESAEVLGDVTATDHRVLRHHTTTASLELALHWLGAGLAREIRTQTEALLTVPVEQKHEVIEQVLRRIARDELQPVLVFDDTDRWVREATRPAVQGFFRDVLRWVNELPASLVVAVHPTYFRGALSRAEVLAHLDTPVEIPDLSAPADLGSLLGRRIEVHVADTDHSGAEVVDLIDAAALDVLFGYYQQTGVYLRSVVQVVHRALVEAADRGADRLNTWFIEGAIAAA